MKKHKEYALLVISLHNQSGKAVNALTDALFRKLNKASKAKRSGLTVSVSPIAQDRGEERGYEKSVMGGSKSVGGDCPSDGVSATPGAGNTK